MKRFIEKIWKICPECRGQRLVVYRGEYIRCNNRKCQHVMATVESLADMLDVGLGVANKFLVDYQDIIDTEYKPTLDSMYCYDSAYVRFLDDCSVLHVHEILIDIRGKRYLQALAKYLEMPERLVLAVIRKEIWLVPAKSWSDALRALRRYRHNSYVSIAA